ncbi:tRNA lysidine(34) synthetase TilS [Acidihalobacter ferrooxydans]|uniref:tRNA(Ile)-lysidine synthase n=1 Tax=Acidihalobacter ferrooxydans TaxID=1765967 RepID=A0A1P8ULD3_9GAMM|nr:tRNA lysidine(34) synthetase TilS [Acidihalobacter ferrooxydans]
MLARQLRGAPGIGRWLVGFSGGADSTALLHALVQLDGLGRELLAVHVHHGLQPQADAWADICAAVAARHGVPFRLERVAVAAQGQGPEAAAREMRYAALAACMAPGDVLLTAHHRGDQAETLLLQLLRSAGPAGLAGMPQWAPFARGWHARPLLNQPKDALLSYLVEHGVSWLEDPSNQALEADRNYLRHRILPALQARWPAVERSLANAARLQADALELTVALGRQDAHVAAGDEPGTLSVGALRRLKRSRLHNVLRVWIADKGLPLPPANRLEQVRTDVLEASTDAQPRLCWSGAELRRYRDALYAMAPLPPHDPTQVYVWPAGRMTLALPGSERGLSTADLRTDLRRVRAPVTIRFRRGGERCRIQGEPHTRALKTLLQNAGVPPWVRDRIPLLYVGDHLREVIGYWVCAAPADEFSNPSEDIDT